MKKEIPKVYANRFDKKLENNCRVCVTKSDEIIEETTNEESIDNEINLVQKDIHQKIKEIFNSNRYVYKADVVITLKEETITKRIIGQSNNQLITMDNELIPISDIIDITFKN